MNARNQLAAAEYRRIGQQTARSPNPDLFIVACAATPPTVRLRRAGANRVVSPYDIGHHPTILAIQQPDSAFAINLSPQHTMYGGDTLLVIGPPQAIAHQEAAK